MARPLRIEYEGAFYHVTSRGNMRQEMFLDAEDYTRFLTTLSEVVERYRWIVHAYCLMRNHYHLLVETPERNLSSGMRQLNMVCTASASTHGTRRSGICFRVATRPSLWRRTPTSSSSPGTSS